MAETAADVCQSRAQTSRVQFDSLLITWECFGHIEGLCGECDEGAHGDDAMGVEAEHIGLLRVQLSCFHQGYGAVLRTFSPHPKPGELQGRIRFCI